LLISESVFLQKSCFQFAFKTMILQGNVVTHLMCGGIFGNGIITDFLLILTVRKFRKSVNI